MKPLIKIGKEMNIFAFHLIHSCALRFKSLNWQIHFFKPICTSFMAQSQTLTGDLVFRNILYFIDQLKWQIKIFTFTGKYLLIRKHSSKLFLLSLTDICNSKSISSKISCVPVWLRSKCHRRQLLQFPLWSLNFHHLINILKSF